MIPTLNIKNLDINKELSEKVYIEYLDGKLKWQKSRHTTLKEAMFECLLFKLDFYEASIDYDVYLQQSTNDGSINGKHAIIRLQKVKE